VDGDRPPGYPRVIFALFFAFFRVHTGADPCFVPIGPHSAIREHQSLTAGLAKSSSAMG
jgi:hypothetical protein